MKGHTMIDIKVPDDADVIVLQRLTHKYLVQAVDLIKAKGIAVVIDMDDDLSCIDPANPSFLYYHPRSNTEHSWHNATRACIDANFVTVSTPALLKTYAPHGRGVVIPNCVPRFFTRIPHDDTSDIGWAGSVHSHPNDLQVMGPTVQKLTNDGFPFKIVGGRQNLGTVFSTLADRLDATGIIDFQRWPLAVNTLGVGLAPLADTKFNAAKSWLKPLEYAALGVASVSSPRVEYKRLHDQYGIGNLATTASQWYKIARDLARNPVRRIEEGQRDRQIVDDFLTFENNAWRWLEAWSAAETLRTAKPGTAFSRP